MARTQPKHLGNLGEELAARFLTTRGIAIVGRNVFVDRDEIDIIYAGPRGRVAVEVKTVHHGTEPFDALTGDKLFRLRRAASGYAQPIASIDAIGVSLDASGVTVRWLRSIG